MTAARQRLFVAVELPAHARTALAAWGRAACERDPALRPVRADALHVTVHFLGDRPTADVEALRAVVAGQSVQAFALSVAGTLWLAPRRPHVLTCGLEDPSGALGALHRSLRPQLEAATRGWAGDGRALRPHVTVARVRRGARPRVTTVADPPALTFAASALALMRSDLAPGGAVYEPLERILLHADA